MADRPPTRPAVSAGRSIPAICAFLVIFLAALGADLALKRWSFAEIEGRETVVLAPKVLALHLVKNRGAVFGLGQGWRWLFVAATVVAVGVVGYFFLTSRPDQWVLHACLALILAGSVGNVYDRLVHGYVRDMLWLFPGVKLPFGWTWPGGADELYPWVFNLADSFLLVGIVVILARSMFVAEHGGGAARGIGNG